VFQLGKSPFCQSHNIGTLFVEMDVERSSSKERSDSSSSSDSSDSDNEAVRRSVERRMAARAARSPEMRAIPGLRPASTPRLLPTQAAVEAAALAVRGGLNPLPRSTPSPTNTANSDADASNKRKKSSPGTTTARQAKKGNKKKSRIGPKSRVKVKRSELYPVLITDQQRSVCKDFNDNYNFYGNCISGSGSKGWKIAFDSLPVGEKEVVLLRRKIQLVGDGEEEVLYDRATDMEKYAVVEKTKKKKQPSPLQQSDIDFKKLSVEDRQTVAEFVMKYKKEGDAIKWKILMDTEYLKPADDPCHYPDGVEFLKEINFIEDGLDKVFFEDFFPSVVGHGELLDEFFSNPKAPYYKTVKDENYKFNRVEDDDPDWLVKNCYLLMLAAVGEVKLGIDNLWSKGPCLGGRRDFADFGRYVPKNMFKAWQAAAPLMWSHRKFWYEESRNKTWELFLPVVKAYNEKRTRLIKTKLLMIDESMSAWRPKTSKRGGLPNITYEPRKPVPLGTQFRNGVECYSGCLVFQDVAQNAEEQHRKEFFYADVDNRVPRLSHLPLRNPMQQHTAEVMRQVKGANLVRGGWVGGDAWFGSVMTCIELMKEFGVFSTFIVKTHTLFFPMAALHSVLSARHGNKPAGHWVTMTTTIDGIKVHAIAYAWSQKGVSYFVSTCGDTEPSVHKYQSLFEDEWGNTQVREINRPNIAHFLYMYLPLIDEHNKQRQSLLCLEKRWLTKDVWFRLLTTLLGMGCVDMHRVYRYYEIKEMGKTYEEVDSLRIIEFSDSIAAGLRLFPYKQQRRSPVGDAQRLDPLERIRDDLGSIHRKMTPREERAGKSVGQPVVRMCYICRRYRRNGQNIQQQTSKWCRQCRMPICDKSRVGGKRTMTCLDEHKESTDPDLGCVEEVHTRSKQVPQRLWIELDERTSKRKR
jgi:Transposase IS4